MEPKGILEEFKKQLLPFKGEFEIFLLKETHSEVEVKHGRVHSFETAETWGAALRLVQEGRLGFCFTNDLTDTGVERAVKGAGETIRYSDRSEFLRLPQDKSETPDLKDFDPLFHRISPPQRIEKALELEKAALSHHSKVTKVRGASYQGMSYEVWLANSWGLERHHEHGMNVLSLMAVAEENGEAESAFEFEFSPSFEALNPEKVGKRAAEKALRYLGGKPGPTLKGPVLLDPLAAAEILEVLAPSFYADNRVKKRSLFPEPPGSLILSPRLSLTDDGTRAGGFSTFPFDGEGVPRRPLKVVEGGVFRTALCDTEYGARIGEASNGASQREGLKRPPLIGHSNFFIEPGQDSFEDLLKTIERGVYLTELIGIHTANPISGDFSVGAQGFLIENGKVASPIKQVALSGNLKEMMNRVLKVGSDLRFLFKMGSPSLLISEMDVAGG